MQTSEKSSSPLTIDATTLEPFSHCALRGHTLYKIIGEIPPCITFNSDDSIHFQSPLPKHTRVEANGNIELAQPVGDFVELSAEKISGTVSIGSNCRFTARGNIDLRSMLNHNHLNADGNIDIRGSGGRGNNLCSLEHINLHTLGEFSFVHGSSVSGYHVGNESDVTATDGRIHIAYVGDNSILSASEEITVNHPGKKLQLKKIDPIRRPTPVQRELPEVPLNTAMGAGIHELGNHYYITEETADLAPVNSRVTLVDRLRDLGAVFRDTTPTESNIPGAKCEITMPHTTVGHVERQEAREVIQSFIHHFTPRQH